MVSRNTVVRTLEQDRSVGALENRRIDDETMVTATAAFIGYLGQVVLSKSLDILKSNRALVPTRSFLFSPDSFI